MEVVLFLKFHTGKVIPLQVLPSSSRMKPPVQVHALPDGVSKQS